MSAIVSLLGGNRDKCICQSISLVSAISVTGEDASSFLQGQLSQDIESMNPGQIRKSLLLRPDGKLGYLIYVYRKDDGFRIFNPFSFEQNILERLKQYCIRVKVEFDISELEISILARTRRELVSCNQESGSPLGRIALGGGNQEDGLTSTIGATLIVEEIDPLAANGRLEIEDLELLRIIVGEPKNGVDLRPGMFPHELGSLDEVVSFRKGCYTGQELVERVSSRHSSAPRRLTWLTGILSDAPHDSDLGANGMGLIEGSHMEVHSGDDVIGEVTSLAYVAGRVFCLALVNRGRKIADTIKILGDTGVLEVNREPRASV